MELEVFLEQRDSPVKRLCLKPGACLNRGYQELCSAKIVQPTGEGWSFRVDDEELPATTERTSVVWKWTPGFYAGEVIAELVRRGDIVATYRLDVSPDPNKLGRDVFNSMVQELWETDPALVTGREPARKRVGNLGAEEDPLLAYARLRQYGASFTTALRGVSREPIRSLRQRRDVVSYNSVRRVDARTAMAALRNAATAAILAPDLVPSHSHTSATPTFEVPHCEEHLDGSANRCLTAMLYSVERRAKSVIQRLEAMAQSEGESATKTPLIDRWPARRNFLIGLLQELAALRRVDPYRSVTRAEITAAGLNAVSAHPLYGRAYGLGWRVIRRGVAGDPKEGWLWMSPSWEIYEKWCFLRLTQALRTILPGFAWADPKRWVQPGRVEFSGDDKHGTHVALLLQPRFPAGDSKRTNFWSVSKEREPDIVLTIDKPTSRHMVIFDAKYRHSRQAVLDAMTSAHIYRDSLRWRDQSPDLSLLLIPASGGAQWLEEAAFVREHGVGLIPLSPSYVSKLLYDVLEWSMGSNP